MTPVRIRGVTLRRAAEPASLVTPDGAEHVLNSTALALWQLCDGKTQVTEMVDAVTTLFGLDRDRAMRDVEAGLAALEQDNLISWT